MILLMEIGPGLGNLSALLAAQVQRVIAVELDTAMVAILETEMAAFANFCAVPADILDMAPATILQHQYPDFRPDTPYQVVANLP